MQRLPTFWVFLVLTATALSGCSSKTTDEHGGEPDAATLAGTGYDRAVGNGGFRVTGSLTGAAAALGDGSAVQIDALDIVTDDTGGAKDKATLILDAKETGLNVQAAFRSMATKTDAKATGDHFGGVGRNVKVFGATGVGPSALPEVTAYLFAAGFANVKLGDKVQSGRLVYIAVIPALRDHHEQTALTEPDADNVQIHVIFPGSTVTGGVALDGVPDGFLYYYFETVAVTKLIDAEKADIGKTLVKPEAANTPPVAAGTIMVGGKASASATQEGDKNVTVTFDGSASKDADGEISRWVWRVGELTTNNTYERPKDPNQPAVVQGKTVEYQFSSPGPKLVELTVVDPQGGSASINLNFYVNFHRIQQGGGSYQSQAAGGGTTCSESVNCFQNTTTIGPGFVSATYTFKKAGSTTQITNSHVDIYAPGKANTATDKAVAASAANGALTVSAATLKGVAGRYTLWVWYEAGSSVGGRDGNPQTLDSIYDIESSIIYAPTVA